MKLGPKWPLRENLYQSSNHNNKNRSNYHNKNNTENNKSAVKTMFQEQAPRANRACAPGRRTMLAMARHAHESDAHEKT